KPEAYSTDEIDACGAPRSGDSIVTRTRGATHVHVQKRKRREKVSGPLCLGHLFCRTGFPNRLTVIDCREAARDSNDSDVNSCAPASGSDRLFDRRDLLPFAEEQLSWHAFCRLRWPPFQSCALLRALRQPKTSLSGTKTRSRLTCRSSSP